MFMIKKLWKKILNFSKYNNTEMGKHHSDTIDRKGVPYVPSGLLLHQTNEKKYDNLHHRHCRIHHDAVFTDPDWRADT